MTRTTLTASLTLCLLPAPGWAAAPKVAVDIAPLHSIVTQVMTGIGEPDLLIQPEASPHHYSLRPSEAEALAEADVVFWVSGELTPWLDNSLDTLAGSATTVKMLDLPATTTYEFREGATFEAHEHHDEGEAQHDEDEAHHDEGEEHDPHAWLDPLNAKAWAGEIAKVLSKQDPSNADAYRQNALAFGESIDELTASLEARAQALEGIKFIMFHDAYQYFERRFDLIAAGAISIGDASDPGPKRIREIQTLVADTGVTCAFTEPQYNPDLLDTVFEGSAVKTVGVMDPLGADIEIGADQYEKLIKNLMTSLEACKSQL